MLTRREVIAGASGLAVLGITGGAVAQNAVLPRPRVYGTQTPTGLASYKLAVGEMLKLPKTDPRNWYRQALIHIADCPHGNWWFLPWHRAHLARFEAICGELIGDSNFRLPYWDYTESPSVPIAFWDTGLDPTKAPFDQDRIALFSELSSAASTLWGTLSPAAISDLARKGINDANGLIADANNHWRWGSGPRRPSRLAPSLNPSAQSMVSKNYLTRVIGSQSFVSFASGSAGHHSESTTSGLLETGPHDNVHGATGGFMGAFMSPVDPIFWLHHANLDRLWDIWSRGKGFSDSTGLPNSSPAEQDLKQRFERRAFHLFCDAKGNSIEVTTAESLSPPSLGYSYESGSLSELAARAPTPSGIAPLSPLGTALPNLNRLFRKGFESSATVAVRRSEIVEALDNTSRELIALISLKAPDNAQMTRVRVYLNCPYLSQFTPLDDPHYVGTLSFFGSLHHAGHNHSETKTVALGPTLEKLRSAGLLPRSAFRIQLIPETLDGEALLLGGELEGVSIAIA
ncbi:MAG: tyrosinase family protein [Aquidulcibacter sp.]|uniref:tyrosinase family protein n=1 Tax=Aquidulcibacter sp. TaxID=2052990 RepID=UPI0022BB187B|nr:tyrosinase family protein [Aquidulcibacter sp.]